MYMVRLSITSTYTHATSPGKGRAGAGGLPMRLAGQSSTQTAVSLRKWIFYRKASRTRCLFLRTLDSWCVDQSAIRAPRLRPRRRGSRQTAVSLRKWMLYSKTSRLRSVLRTLDSCSDPRTSSTSKKKRLEPAVCFSLSSAARCISMPVPYLSRCASPSLSTLHQVSPHLLSESE